MKIKKILIFVVVVVLALSFTLYGFYPITVVKNIPVQNWFVKSMGVPGSSLPVFSNVTIPSNAMSVSVYVSMNTVYPNGTKVNPDRIIVGLFAVNGSSWGIKKAGYYNPSEGFYEIIVSPLIFKTKYPATNPNGSLNLSKFQYYNYTYLGKTFGIAIDLSLNYQIEYSTINWIKLVYSYKRF